jgi:hypothetical protein
MAPLHGGSSAGKSDLCCGRSLDVEGRPGLHQSGLMSICFAGCLSLGPRKNDLTIYWDLEPFVRSFTLLVDPGDIYPPQLGHARWRQGRAKAVPAHLIVSGLGRHYGPSWWPRHDTVYQPGPALCTGWTQHWHCMERVVSYLGRAF